MLRKETLDRLRRLSKRLGKKSQKSSYPSSLSSAPSLTEADETAPSSKDSRASSYTAAIRQRLSQSKSRKPQQQQRLLFADSTSRSGLATGREVTNIDGRYWLVRRPLPRLWSAAQSYLQTWHSQFSQQSSATRSAAAGNVGSKKSLTPIEQIQQHPDYLAFHSHFPDECLFLDLETCGFAGAAIFLAGVIHTLDGELVLSQLWARNYAEERALLRALGELLVGKRVLVTFNGKTFDWPQVCDRTILYSGSPDCGLPDLVHVDLLHLSRRRWKRQLTDCKLQTLERHICGRQRFDDVPGREIPDVYQHYVRTGDTTMVDGVLHHNALDLVTLLQLSLIVGQPE